MLRTAQQTLFEAPQETHGPRHARLEWKILGKPVFHVDSYLISIARQSIGHPERLLRVSDEQIGVRTASSPQQLRRGVSQLPSILDAATDAEGSAEARSRPNTK